MAKVNEVVRTNTPLEMPRERVTRQEISAVKAQFIRENLLLTLDEAGQILGKSSRTILDWIKDGKLVAADEHARNTGRASSGIRVTAASVERCRIALLVPTEKWGE